MQQEKISRKNSELLMMLESFEEQDEEDTKAADQKENGEKEQAESTDNLMEGRFGAVAVRGELGIKNYIHPVKAGKVTIPFHNKDLPKGTENSIRRQAGLK